MAMSRVNFATFSEKESLRHLLADECLTLSEIIKRLSVSRNISRNAIYQELQKGLSKEDYSSRRYAKYDPEMSQKFEIMQIMKKAEMEAEKKLEEIRLYKESKNL